MKYFIVLMAVACFIACNDRKQDPVTKKPGVDSTPPSGYGSVKGGLVDTAKENQAERQRAAPESKKILVKKYSEQKGTLDDTALEVPRRKNN